VNTTAEDCEATSQGTPTCIDVTAKKGDLNLNDQEGGFYTFCIYAGLLVLWLLLCENWF